MTHLPALMVAPNGSYLQKSDHPLVPISLSETISCAVACHQAGADGLHLHLRTKKGEHLLDTGMYREAVQELIQHMPDMQIQITTEAAGKYDPKHQKAVALESGAHSVSASVRELLRDDAESFARFQMLCFEQGIAIQHILYDVEDCQLLRQHLPDTLLRSPDLQLLFVLGRYSETKDSEPQEVDPFLSFLDQENIQPDWAVCAFGKGESVALRYAHGKGGKCRIGFENSLWLSDGTLAKDNADKVLDFQNFIQGQV